MQYPPNSAAMRLHALYELFRRAGMSSADWSNCQVSIDTTRVEVRLGWDTSKKIHFPVFPNGAEGFRTVRMAWMTKPSSNIEAFCPDFVLPHHPEPLPEGPLFERAEDHAMRCKTDLPLIALAVMCRWEEAQSLTRDQFGRFPAKASIAFQERFLDRPIVDEYGLALEQAIKALSPAWRPSQRDLRLKLSHDIDLVGLPFQLRSAIGATVRRHRPLDTVRWFASLALKTDPPPLRAVDQVVNLSLERGLDSAVYWMASKRTPYDTGYSLFDSRIQKRISSFRDRGVEMGIHPSYFSFGDPELLRNEVNTCRSAIGDHPIGGRQHFLRWLPDTWRHWEGAGLSYDSSVGYADCIGFRAGTCVPSRPWSVADNRPMKLLEIPLLVMDGTLIHADYMGLGRDEAIEGVVHLAAKCRNVGGVFTFLCHNDKMTDPDFGEEFYLSLVEAIGTNSKCDWLGELREQVRVIQPAAFAEGLKLP